MLARPHVLDELQLRETPVAPLQVRHESRQNPDDTAASAQRAIRERPHRSARAATVYDLEPAPGQHLAEPEGGLAILRMRSPARGAVHTDRSLSVRLHSLYSHAAVATRKPWIRLHPRPAVSRRSAGACERRFAHSAVAPDTTVRPPIISTATCSSIRAAAATA